MTRILPSLLPSCEKSEMRRIELSSFLTSSYLLISSYILTLPLQQNNLTRAPADTVASFVVTSQHLELLPVVCEFIP
jgi:hypothetical protein